MSAHTSSPGARPVQADLGESTGLRDHRPVDIAGESDQPALDRATTHQTHRYGRATALSNPDTTTVTGTNAAVDASDR